MRLLLLTHSFNSLSQRLFVELAAAGHEVSVEFDIHDDVTREAIRLWAPDVVIAPYLRRMIPEDVWRAVRCLVVHPGPAGDRGPSALDYAVLENEKEWGVTILEANGEFDAGGIRSEERFPMRAATKGSLYRNEVTAAAVKGVKTALAAIEAGEATRPLPVENRFRPYLRQEERAIDWRGDDTATVLRRIRAADGSPGVLDEIFGREFYLHGAHPEETLRGAPGEILGRSWGAICRSTRDGAVWISHLRPRIAGERTFKLSAELALGDEVERLPPLEPSPGGFREIDYAEEDGIGRLSFDFHNGAMSVSQCLRLRDAVRAARARDTRALILEGGRDFWSNGIHLNVIEAAPSPAEESLRNIEAMNDLVREILTMTDKLTVAAVGANAAAGGFFLALACDLVLLRKGVILNPHYKNMGNLFGSEYWTYTLGRRAIDPLLREHRLPLGAAEARRLGLADEILEHPPREFFRSARAHVRERISSLDFPAFLTAKSSRLASDEKARPLEDYRRAEMDMMRLNFFGFDPSYHAARHDFVAKVPHSRTPLHLARHRRKG